MIKANELRKKSLEELYQLRKELDMEKIKASTLWALQNKTNKELGLKVTKKGTNTNLQKNLRRLYARVETIIKEKTK